MDLDQLLLTGASNHCMSYLLGPSHPGPIFQETVCGILHIHDLIYYKNKCCLVRYFLSPPSPNMRVLGKLGPGISSPSKLGPLLIWQQIGPHTFWCRGRLGPGQFDPCIIYSFVLDIYYRWLGNICQLNLYVGIGHILPRRDIFLRGREHIT